MTEPGKIKKKKPHRFYDYSLLFTIGLSDGIPGLDCDLQRELL